MYDFPECKYTYFSLIDKSLGHLFHLPASILTRTRLECPLSKIPPQFARFPPRFSTQNKRTANMPHHHATPSCQAITPKATAPKNKRPTKAPNQNHPQAVLKVLARLKYSVPLYKAESGFSILAEECLTFRTITPYNVSRRAFADILSASLSVYFTSIGRYFFSSFTFPEDLAISTTFFIAVRSSGLIFNTLL